MSSHFVFSDTEKLRNPDTPYNEKDSVVIAVDLGCEFTKVSYWNFEDGCSSIVKINGLESFPTAISYSSRNEFVVGKEAIKNLQTVPKQVILHFPVLCGYEKEELAVKAIRQLSVCELVRDHDAKAQWHIITKKDSFKLTLEDVTSDFLSYIKTEVSNELKKSVSAIFIICPIITPEFTSFFKQISSLIFTPIELISSSTALCLSYGFYDHHESKTLLLMDFGWDMVTLQVVENVDNEYRKGPVLVCDDLSGRNLSITLYNNEFNKIRMDLRSVLANDYITKNKILMNVYNCLNHTKKLLDLSKSEKGIPQDRKTSFGVSSKAFQKVITTSIEKFDKSLTDFFDKYSLTVNSFDDVLISGGIANCNYVYEYIQQKFSNIYFPDLLSIYNPHNSVNETVKASGAAIQCARWMGLSQEEIQSLLLIDLLPHDLYMKMGDEYQIIIPKGSSIPSRKTVEVMIEKDQEYLVIEVYRKKEDDEFVNLGEFEFKLNADDVNDSPSVGVIFTVGENGAISATCTGSYEPEVNMTNVIILLIALFFLIVAYLFLKFHFRDTRALLGGNQYIYCLVCKNKPS